LELFDLFIAAERTGFNPERLRRMNLDPGATLAVDRVRRQLQRLCEPRRKAKDERRKEELSSFASSLSPPQAAEQEMLISVLAGYPDRVARRRPSPGGSSTT